MYMKNKKKQRGPKFSRIYLPNIIDDKTNIKLSIVITYIFINAIYIYIY